MKSAARVTGYFFAPLLFLAVGACSPQNPKLEMPLQPLSSVDLSADTQKIDVTPKVDIMVVVDYSMSMARHQKNLADNIQGFIDAFGKNKLVDFHFGVTPIWDSYDCGKDVQGLTATCFPLGQLLPLKNPSYDPSVQGSQQFLSGARYVTKNTPNYLQIMQKTILVGELPGPAFEEIFSPVMPTLTQFQGVGEPNHGFYRKDAYLILIFITDTDASTSDPSAELLNQQLTDLKGDASKILKVGVLSASADKSCPKDQGGHQGPFEIEKFLSLPNSGSELDLCSSSFGPQLAKIGSDLSVKISQQVIPLNGVPDFSPQVMADPTKKFEVRYGSQIVPKAMPPKFDDGWMYDYGSRSIVLGTNTQLSDEPGASLTVQFVKINSINADNGHVKQVGQ